MFSQEEAIRTHRRLVFKMAHRYRRFGVDWDDLVQEGYIGLIEAHKHYDPAKAKFFTLAKFHVRSRMQQYVRRATASVTLPSELFKNSQRESGNSLHMARAILKNSRTYLPEDEEAPCITETLAAPLVDPTTRVLARMAINKIEQLPARERNVLLDHGVCETQFAEIGHEHNLSRERVRQIYEKAAGKVRKTFSSFSRW